MLHSRNDAHYRSNNLNGISVGWFYVFSHLNHCFVLNMNLNMLCFIRCYFCIFWHDVEHCEYLIRVTYSKPEGTVSHSEWQTLAVEGAVIQASAFRTFSLDMKNRINSKTSGKKPIFKNYIRCLHRSEDSQIWFMNHCSIIMPWSDAD